MSIAPAVAAPPRFEASVSRWPAAAGAIAAGVAVAYGLTNEPARLWTNLLVDGFLLVALALGGMTFVAIHLLSGASWSTGMRRIGEALGAVLPFAAVAMLALFFGRATLYPWAAPRAAGAGLETSSWFFSPPAVFGRMALLLGVWSAMAIAFRRSSDQQHASPDPAHHRAAVRRAAAGAVLLAVSLPIASIDWLMSLTPGWTSTIFFVYVFAGVLVEGVAAVTLATVLLRERGLLRGVVTEAHLHDLGKLLFAFTMFWAYIWLCQYLLIWYGNLPDEVGYYETRTGPVWLSWFLGNLVVNWALPFVVLLRRDAKRDPSTLKVMAIVLLAGRWLDVYLLVAPETLPTAAFGALELAIAAGYAAIAWQVIAATIASRPLVARHDPCLDACLDHGQ